VRFKVLKATSMNMTVFRVVSHSTTEFYLCFSSVESFENTQLMGMKKVLLQQISQRYLCVLKVLTFRNASSGVRIKTGNHSTSSFIKTSQPCFKSPKCNGKFKRLQMIEFRSLHGAILNFKLWL
jgi:hypothetical protein